MSIRQLLGLYSESEGKRDEGRTKMRKEVNTDVKRVPRKEEVDLR